MTKQEKKVQNLFVKYKKYIEFECKKITVPGYDIEDLKQEVSAYIFTEYPAFDNKKGLSENSWILMCIRQRLYQLLRQETYPKRMPHDAHGQLLFFEQLRSQTDEDEVGEVKVTDIVSAEVYAGRSEYYETPEYKHEYKCLIKEVRKRLSEEACLIFDAKLKPKKGLLRLIQKENEKRKAIKERGYNTKEIGGITNTILSKYFGFNLTEIQQYLEEIKSTIHTVSRGLALPLPKQ